MFIIFINLLKFLVCLEAKIVNFTIKVHQLYSPIHLEKEMSDSQETVILGLCQGLEQLHSELNKTQKLHNSGWSISTWTSNFLVKIATEEIVSLRTGARSNMLLNVDILDNWLSM